MIVVHQYFASRMISSALALFSFIFTYLLVGVGELCVTAMAAQALAGIAMASAAGSARCGVETQSHRPPLTLAGTILNMR